MNFDFSDELKQLQAEARRFLGRALHRERGAVGAGRRRTGTHRHCGGKWRNWAGSVPQFPKSTAAPAWGTRRSACSPRRSDALSRRCRSHPRFISRPKRSCAPAREAQKRAWLPRLARGEVIGTLAWAEGAGNPDPHAIKARVAGGRLSGSKRPVADGGIADFAVVAARDERNEVALVLADLRGEGVQRSDLQTVDPDARPRAHGIRARAGRDARRRRRLGHAARNCSTARRY